MANAHRLHTLPLLTGQQEVAVKNHHLVPDVISALKYPARHTMGLKRHAICLIGSFECHNSHRWVSGQSASALKR